jgi:electron transfer flavoprotein alpha subunit
MPNVWVYAEVSEGKLASISLEILTKAAELGDASAILLGSAPDDAVQTLGNYGAKKVYRCAGAIFDQHLVLPEHRGVRLWIGGEHSGSLSWRSQKKLAVGMAETM